MGILSLSISFVVIALILICFAVVVGRNENNVHYVVSIVYPKDHVIPKERIQAELMKLFTRGIVVLVLTFILALILLHFFTSLVLWLHILLIVPVLIFAIMFRHKMDTLDHKYGKKH